MASKAIRTVDAQNEWTDAIRVRGSKLVDCSIVDIAGGSTITIQRSFDGGTTWLDVETHTADAERVLQSAVTCDMRVGCKTGEFGSGTTDVRIEAGNAY